MSKSTHNHLTKCLAVTLDVPSAILIGAQDGRTTPEGSFLSAVLAARPFWLAAAHRAGGRRMESVCSYSAASTMTGGRPVHSSPSLPAVQPPRIRCFPIWFSRASVVRIVTPPLLLPIHCEPVSLAHDASVESFRSEARPFTDQRPNHALQRTRPSRSGCNPRVPRAGSLSLGR